jgi:hypothetical protein
VSSEAKTVITASAVATHPDGVVLGEDGSPVLDEHGDPVEVPR